MEQRVRIWLVLFIALLLFIPMTALPPPAGTGTGAEKGTAPAEETHFPRGRSTSRAAGEPVRPDIVITNLSWSIAGPYDGAGGTLVATVFNDGLSTFSPFPVELYADGEAAGMAVVNGLSGGSSSTVKAGWTASPGSHEFRAISDPADIIAESNETNNFKVAYLEIPYPDLVITNVSWYPDQFREGDKVTVAATIKNIGTGGTTRQFVLEAFIDQVRLTNRIFGGLGAASSALATVQWTASAGNHTLYMTVDPGAAVKESNEMNNRYVVHPGQDYPDIITSGVSVSPAGMVDGGSLVLGATVGNSGKGGTTQHFTVGFIVDGQLAGSAGVWGLASNSSSFVSVSWISNPGHHDLRVQADHGSEVTESVESNNYQVMSFYVPWPDLAVKDIRVDPAVPTDGRQVRLNITVSNIGNGSTARQFAVGVMVDGVLIATPGMLGSVRGEESTVTALWTAGAGGHEIRAQVDASRLVPELDETNNVMVKAVDVPYPDIAVSNISYSPQNPAPGEPVFIRASVRNAGPGNTSRYFEVKFFAGGKEAGSFPFDGLNTGFVKNLSVSWNAEPGSSDLVVMADTRGDIREQVELDNSAAARIEVPYPDIEVRGMVWTPGNASAGQPLNVTVTIQNTGTGNASYPFTVDLHSDGGLLQTQRLANLRAGENRSVNFSFILPSTPAWLRAQADPQGTVVELSETNNNLTLRFPNRTVVAPLPPLDIAISEVRSFPERPVDGDNVNVVASIKAFNLSSGVPLGVGMLLLVDARQTASMKVDLLAEEGLATFEWKATPGTHTLQVVADAQHLHHESNEDNNRHSAQLSISPADMVVTGLVPSQPNATDGEMAAVFCNIANLGPGDTKMEIPVNFFVDGELVQAAKQGGLPAGQTSSLVFSFMAFPGVHRLRATANPGGSVLETSATNNNAVSQISVERPDIVVTRIDVPATAGEGDSVAITATISNVGGGTVRETQVALLIDAVQIGKLTVSSLLAGKSATVSNQWTATPGGHIVTAAAQLQGSMGEMNGSDNWLSVQGIDVGSSDIRILDLSIERPPVEGSDCLVSARLQNTGHDTLRDLGIGFCIDEMMVKTVNLGGLPANSSHTVTQTIPIGPGLHTLKVTADILGSVEELDETNNDAVLEIDLAESPDLFLAGLRVPAEAVDGEQVHIFAEVENSGAANFTGRFVVAVFVDGLKVADVPVAGMVAGGSTTIAAKWTATPGTHYFRAVADPHGSIPEVNETDNELHREGAMVEQPDLTVWDVSTVKGFGQAGTDAFMVFATVENLGGATLRPVHVAALADAAPLGNIEILGLPGMDTTQVSLPVHSLNPQRITVIVDYDDSIAEHDEFNNEAGAGFAPAVELPGTRPDLTVSDISFSPPELMDGQPAVVFVTVANTGNASLTAGVNVELNGSGTSPQTTLHGILPGETAIIGFPWTPMGGSTTFNATVDIGRTQPEWSDEDNWLVRTLEVRLPDYRISSLIRWNSTEGLGDPMFAVVENIGTGDTVRPTSLDIFIEGVLRSQNVFNGLRSGEQITLAIPRDAVSGSSELRLEIDRLEQVRELDEGNNVMFDSSYTRYPELSITNISWTPPIDNGSRVALFVEVQNSGTGSTGRPVRVSLSVDSANLDTGIIYGLPANSTTVLPWKWTLQPGNHTFSAFVDNNDAVWEPNENDNRMVVDFPSGRRDPAPPLLNLRLANLTYLQSSKLVGKNTLNIITVVISVQNDAEQNLTGSIASLMADSLLVAELPIPPVAVQSGATIAYPWNATVANHTVKVLIDFRRQFPEDIETDNDLAIEIEKNDPPDVYPVGNYSVLAGDPLTLHGSGNDVQDGFIALYEWDLDGDGAYEYNSTVSGTVQHVYHTNGTFIICLRLTDDRGATAVSTGFVVVKLKQEKPFLRADEVTFVAVILSFSVLAGAAVMLYRKRDDEPDQKPPSSKK
jgi:subtilase family serine protease